MARSQGVIVSVNAPIAREAMTKKAQQRLRQILGRDTRVILAFLGIIQQHERALLTGCDMTKVDESELDKLTMTALKVYSGCSQRVSVPHDMKARFPRISPNELNECRQTAVAAYEGYLQQKRNGLSVSRPYSRCQMRRIPRFVFMRRFKIVEHHTSASKWWLNLRDSLDSAIQARKTHDRLLIPLRISPFHLNQFDRGDIKSLRIHIDMERRWWATFAVRVNTLVSQANSLPPAVLGIDLGIEKAACTALVTPEKVRETRYFVQKNKLEVMKKLDLHVAALQHELAARRNEGQSSDGIALKLRRIRQKRERVAREYDRVLVAQLTNYVQDLSQMHTVYVALGRLRYIRFSARRGNHKGCDFRGMVHRWAFARIAESFKHQLAQLGWTVEGRDSRFRVVSEGWTSTVCWKCARKGRRPRQSYFVCPTCGHKTNADRNGAINIAGRLIMLTSSLREVRGLGKWADSAQAGAHPLLKAGGKSHSSPRMSLLFKKSDVSNSEESAAVHRVRKGSLSSGDRTVTGDNDRAVVRTVEDISVVGDDTPTSRQEKEARSVGEMPSQ